MLIYRLFVTLCRDGVKHDFSLKYEAKDERDAEDTIRKVLEDLNSGVEYAEFAQKPYLWWWEDDRDVVCFDPRDVLSIEWESEGEKIIIPSGQNGCTTNYTFTTMPSGWVKANLGIKEND